MATFSISVDGIVVAGIRAGENLGEICDSHALPLAFRCRGASCGTCAVRVVDGVCNLSRMSENESILLEGLFDSPPDVRLACQLDLVGPVTVVSYEE
jgi:ferredoxin